MTKNNAALRILQEQNLLDTSRTLIIFGSSFPHDQEYTQICSNINRIKIAMELGQTVVLCNLNNLYESLYDALNQNYVMLGGKRYVDLGLGTHRVKCRVHEDFRLIVVAEDKEVYEKFPIPLINRLEKHFLGMETMTTDLQRRTVESLKNWAKIFSEIRLQDYERRNVPQFTADDAFVGYHDDVVASMVLRHDSNNNDDHHNGKQAIPSKNEVKWMLLQCATPDSVSRLTETEFPEDEKEELFAVYHLEQRHGCLSDFLASVPGDCRLVQVTTSSRLLTNSGKIEVASDLGLDPERITILSLLQFDTEEQFAKRVRGFLETSTRRRQREMLFIQSEVGLNENQNLVECDRYVVQDLIRKHQGHNFVIVFVLHVPRVAGGCFNGLSVHPWTSCHIDELRKLDSHSLDVSKLRNETISDAFEKGIVPLEEMIMECLPKAASQVSDEDSQRMQKRVEILVRMADSKCKEDQFIETMRMLVSDVVKKKMVNFPNPDRWLVKMAVSSEFMREGNTFQKAIWLHLSQVVTPILRDIVRFCDLDSGLDFLESSKTWILDSFMQLLRLSSWDEMAEAIGARQSTFQSKFPFSRYIIMRLEAWHRRGKEGVTTTGDQLQNVLEEMPQGPVLKFLFQRGFEALKIFIHDFVCVKLSQLPRDNAVVMDFFCEQLYRMTRAEFTVRRRDEEMIQDLSARVSIHESEELEGAGERADVRTESDHYVSPVDVLMAFLRHEKRLIFLMSLCNFMPDLPEKIERRTSREEDCESADFVGFLTLLGEYEPNPDSLVDEDNEVEWMRNVDKVQHLFQQLKSIRTSGESQEKIMKEISATLRRLVIIKSYLKHVCRGDDDPEKRKILYMKVKRLNLALKSNDLKTGKEFDKLIGFLMALNEDIARYHFGSQDVCIVCREDLKEPVKLPCDHCGCKDCLEDHFAAKDGDWICPEQNCRVAVPNDFPFDSSEASLVAVSNHETFKRSLNAFFLDVLHNFVFDGERTPEQEVIEKLMSFVVTKELPKDRMLQSNRTKQISPFAGHCIDSTPVIRSFILQLLLLGKTFTNAQAYLRMYLEEERKFVKDPVSYLELCLLIVFCLEDRLFREDEENEGSGFVSKAQAFKFMKKCSKVAKFQEEGELLTDVARARLALSTAAAVLHRTVTGDDSASEDDKEFLRDVSAHTDSHPMSEGLKAFLTRLLVSRHRRDVVAEWKRKQCFARLMPRSIMEANEEERMDTFLVLGDGYKRIRDSLRQAVATEEFGDHVRMLRQERRAGDWWPLALYFVGVLNGMDEDKATLLSAALENSFPELCACTKELVLPGSPGRRLRDVFPHRNGREEAIVTMLFHLGRVLEGTRKNDLMATLQAMVADPRQTPFLPTMPQDETVEVTRAASGVTRWYNCPLGHIYGIGNCGHPVAGGVCPDCGSAIGGTGYNRFAGTGLPSERTVQAVIADGTQTGHVLGRPDGSRRPPAERDLTGLQVALTR